MSRPHANGVEAPPRRPRPGSVDRPVNSRLYRALLLGIPLALLVAGFTVSRPSGLPPPALPPVYDGESASTLAGELARHYPDRSPGSPGGRNAAAWVSAHFRELGLKVETSRFSAAVPGRGDVVLENVSGIAPGRSESAIVVVAHRDNVGEGPGANDNASGTATLIELARAHSSPRLVGTAGRLLPPLHTMVFLSSDGGTFGALGAARFAERSRFADRTLAVVNLDALAGRGRPQLHIAGDAARSPSPTLIRTAEARVRQHAGVELVRANALEQLLDLAFPFSLYEQAPFVGRGTPAVTLTTAGERPPASFDDEPELLEAGRLELLGRSAETLVGSLDQGFELPDATSPHLYVGSRVVRSWAVMLVAAAALLPFLVAVADLVARSRRRRVALLPAVRCYARRLGFWVVAAAIFALLGPAGLWEDGDPRPLSPDTSAATDWPTFELVVFAALFAAAWLLTRRRLRRRRAVGPEEQLGGYTVALAVLALLGVTVFTWNPFALLLLLPSLHAWLWLPQLRGRPALLRATALAVGFAGPALLLGSLALRFNLGFDAPWYLVQLAAVGYVPPAAVALALVWIAAAGQLVTVATGRYAPYPSRSERAALPSLLRGTRTAGQGTLAAAPMARRMRVR